jgi:hypothetical protein
VTKLATSSAILFLTLLSAMACFSTISTKADDTCKSVRDQLVDELKEKLRAPNAQIALLSLDTLKPIKASGGETGYECTGRANVQRDNRSPQQTIKFIYTVFSGSNLLGYQGIGFTVVGISYICGEDKSWDQIYSTCLK